MRHFIGLDVHLLSTTMVVVDARGKPKATRVVETCATDLIEQVKAVRRPRALCLEEGTQSAWLYEVLSPHVDDLVVTHVAQSRAAKDDRRDALWLANALRLGDVSPVFKEYGSYRELRAVCRAYQYLSSDLVRTKCRLKALYRSRGVNAPGQSVYTESGRGAYLERLPSQEQSLALLLYGALDAQVELKAEAKERMVDESHRHAISRVLETAPGLGPVRVAQLLPIVVTPHRFRTRQQFWSYCGLGVVMRSSSDWVRSSNGNWTRQTTMATRGLNPAFNRRLKSIFKDAALAVIAKKLGPLYEAYQRLTANGTKPPLARLTIARRIAAAVLAMWKAKEVYDPNRAQAQT